MANILGGRPLSDEGPICEKAYSKNDQRALRGLQSKFADLRAVGVNAWAKPLSLQYWIHDAVLPRELLEAGIAVVSSLVKAGACSSDSTYLVVAHQRDWLEVYSLFSLRALSNV